jgi:hypothetical protein
MKVGTSKNKGLYIVPPPSLRRLVVTVGTSKGSTISLWLQYIRGISYRGPIERKKEKKEYTKETISFQKSLSQNLPESHNP